MYQAMKIFFGLSPAIAFIGKKLIFQNEHKAPQ